MKKNIILLCMGFISFCYTEDVFTNQILKNGINYYLEQVIPSYHGGTFDKRMTGKELIAYNIQTRGPRGGIGYVMDTQNLIFDFYYLINHRMQNVQGIMIASEEKNDYLYEYWIFNIDDGGIPYNYAYFYLTKAETKESKREIINISKKYMELYTLENGTILDLTIHNMVIVYQVMPQCRFESFSGTKYENVIVSKRTGKKPYLRKMNFFEILYYRWIKKKVKR